MELDLPDAEKCRLIERKIREYRRAAYDAYLEREAIVAQRGDTEARAADAEDTIENAKRAVTRLQNLREKLPCD